MADMTSVSSLWKEGRPLQHLARLQTPAPSVLAHWKRNLQTATEQWADISLPSLSVVVSIIVLAMSMFPIVDIITVIITAVDTFDVLSGRGGGLAGIWGRWSTS